MNGASTTRLKRSAFVAVIVLQPARLRGTVAPARPERSSVWAEHVPLGGKAGLSEMPQHPLIDGVGAAHLPRHLDMLLRARAGKRQQRLAAHLLRDCSERHLG